MSRGNNFLGQTFFKKCIMKKTFQIILFCFFGFITKSQTIQYPSDVAPIIKTIDNSVSTKQYQTSFSNYSFTLTADTVTNSLLKAVVVDKRSKSTRIYYFRNDYLIKVTEKFDQPNDIESAHHFFVDNNYALVVDYKDDGQPDAKRQRLQNDAYKFLLYYRRINMK
jgi:hypothetical protein